MSTQHRMWWLLGAIAAVGLAVVWALLPWEWSMIDDPGFVLSLRSSVADHGPLLGPVAHAWGMFQVDLDWGLFRPAYWAYPSLVYLLPIGPAHVVRLVLFVTAVAGPVVAVRRSGARWPLVLASTLIVLAASATLAQGLFYVSLQELSGAAFVGLGLILRSRRARLASWVVAAWFKAPFAWMLVGEAIALWRQGDRRLASISGAVGALTIAAGVLFARNGTYTSDYVSGIAERAVSNLPGLLTPGLLAMVLAWLWWLVVARGQLQWSPWSLAFAVGTVAYAAQLLPWRTTAYYPGPVAYLAACLAVSLLRDPPHATRRREVAAVAGPAVLAALMLSLALQTGFAVNQTFRGISDCVISSGATTVALSPELGEEATVRIPQNIGLRSPEWTGTFVVADGNGPELLAEGAEVVVAVRPVDPALATRTRSMCVLPYAEVRTAL